MPDRSLPLVVDLGSGVTFFPFACARLGARVVCTDIDEVCRRDVPRAAAVVDASPGRVEYRHCLETKLPFETGEVAALYCISVLEHVADRTALIQEMARVIKPGGLCLLTLDIDLRGDGSLTPDGYRNVRRELSGYFELSLCEQTTHPREVLTPTRGPWRLVPPPLIERLAWFLKQWIVKPMLGKRPRPLLPYDLAVEGMVLTRTTSSSMGEGRR
jgi:SAM-dependent methyltransferase